MKSAVVYTSDGRLNTKFQRQKEIKSDTINKCPISYKSNTTKEELCLEYINSFIQQFLQSHPNRKVPYMVAENEVGVKKFVCTTLRPTLIPIPELYDLYECASYIAGYILYEPLEPQSEPPRYLFSPGQTLDSYCGDAYDMTTLLTSFLLGSGYDAYVVAGYAPKYITLKDQSMTSCPMISNDNNSISMETTNRINNKSNVDESNLNKEENNNNSQTTSYVPLDNTVKSSKYLIDEAEKQRIAALDTFKLWISDPELDEMKMMEDAKQLEIDSTGSNKYQRMHSWVLVKSGRRDIKENIFIEPSTGRIYTTNNSPYLAIESIWNHNNYWVNMQFEKKVSQIDFNLKEASLWDVLFLTAASFSTEQKSGDQDQLDGDRDELIDDNNQNGNKSESKSSAADTNIRYFDAPPTWANPLYISRNKYLLKYPPIGKRSVQYYCAKADFFARKVHAQSMVMRVTLYLDQECTIVKEIHEWFEGRHDCMYKRIRYFLDQRRFIEYFNPGSYADVKKWVEYPGKRIEVDYYVDGRIDRLVRREENIGEMVIEHFQGRNDFLVYRSVILSADRAKVGSRQFALPTASSNNEIFAIKMTQAYDQDHSPTAITSSSNSTFSGSIKKRVFYVVDGKAVMYYHFGRGKISGDIRTYLHARGPSSPPISEQALSQEIGLDESSEALIIAGSLERDCFTSIKTSFQQNQKLRETRRDTELKIDYERTVFEKALDSAYASNNNENFISGTSATNDSAGTDYLSPFLRNLHIGGGDTSGGSGSMTKEDALEIRQACLDALKARLVERANIIQTKLHEENASLGKIQEHFQRAQREGDFDTEKYESTCTAAMFRIQILEQRLASHEESALRKFADLDTKLSNDPRLRVLRT